jgi:2'-5' RNA ligase
VNQDELPGFSPPTPTDRLFLAIFPDLDTAARIAALADEQIARHGLRCKPLLPGRLHVTLFHLGDSTGLRQDVVDAAIRASSRLHAKPFELRFDEIASFRGRRDKSPFVLKASGGNEALHAFHVELGRGLREEGLPSLDGNRYEPHITMAYGARLAAAENVAPIAWPAEEFVLVHSLLGKTRHIPLARWHLG